MSSPNPLQKPDKHASKIIGKHSSGGDWKEHLAEKGWVAVPVPAFDAEKSMSDLYSWMEGCGGGLDRKTPSTWTKSALPPQKWGIFRHYVGHEAFVWEARLAAKDTFSDIWGTQDLVSSFDGACFYPPEYRASKLWLHSDQPRPEREARCVQGLVNLLECGEKDGGLVVLEGSHKVYPDYLEGRPLDGWTPQWFPDLGSPLLRDLDLVKVCAGPGELILWGSRTFHCNVSPTGKVPRACIYVSMVPSSTLTKEEHKKRVACAEGGRMTGHACRGLGLSIHRADPFMCGRSFLKPTVRKRAFEEEERSLIGYDAV